MFDRDEQEISQIIENGLEAILTGSATLESVVAQHPEQAEVIRPELEGALWLVSQRQEVEARPGFVTASRKRVVERIKVEARNQGAKHSLFGFAWPQRLAYQWVAGAAVILFLLLGTGGLITVSQNSLPGDGLYAVKRASEQVSYVVTINEVQRVQLSAQFAERRIVEVESLMVRKNYPAAKATLIEYEKQVNLTISLLTKASNADSKQKLGVAIAFKEDLLRNTDRINTMLASAPEMVLADLQQAREVSMFGAVLTTSVIDGIPQGNGNSTPTPTPTVTPTFGKTPKPFITNTEVPSSTPTVDMPPNPVTKTVTPRGLITITVTPQDPTETNTLTPAEIEATRRVTKTPRPPSENKPEPKAKKDPPGKNK